MHLNGKETLVRVVDLKKVFRSGESDLVLFENLSFEVRRGEMLALVGASGIDVGMLHYKHSATFRELARPRSPADQDVPSSLPAGWIPMEDNTASRTPVAQRRA